ncbi:MAG: hypothetical protein N2749_03150 [Clostridia bacterium]|nr:hypothetical protein [Clostridia bacterium]
MKYKKTILILVSLIIVFSAISCIVGLFSNDGAGPFEFKSINGETVQINGNGVYKYDSVSVVAQGRASDFVTIVFAIPLLVLSTILSYKGSFKSRLLLSGTLGYFLYTYMSYTFLWMYNPLFIIYVILMSTSFFAFVLTLMSFDIQNIPSMFSNKLPVKFLGGFQLFIAFAIGLLWLGKIAPSILNGAVPLGLEHYTTLVIQGMDLGFVVPVAIISGVLLIKKKAFGYLLSSVIILKLITMLTSISAMIINMLLNGVAVSVIEIVLFSIFDLLAIISLIILLSNLKTNLNNES